MIEDAYTSSTISRIQTLRARPAANRPNTGFGINPRDGIVPPSTTAAEADTELASGLNYLRNSVKAVIDMYDERPILCDDPSDPVLAAYRRAFPGAFADLSQLPEV